MSGIRFNISVTDGVSKELRAIADALDGEKAAELTQQGGRAAVVAAAKYHRDFDQQGGWRGKNYLGPGKKDGSSFGSLIASGWYVSESDRDTVTIANNTDHYAFKVTGGTIRPKRAKALTLPLIPEAKGVHASVYEQNTGRKLFISKSKNALLERSEGSTKGVRAVYALVKSVTQGPWKGALPPDGLLADAFTGQYLAGLEEIKG